MEKHLHRTIGTTYFTRDGEVWKQNDGEEAVRLQVDSPRKKGYVRLSQIRSGHTYQRLSLANLIPIFLHSIRMHLLGMQIQRDQSRDRFQGNDELTVRSLHQETCLLPPPKNSLKNRLRKLLNQLKVKSGFHQPRVDRTIKNAPL